MAYYYYCNTWHPGYRYWSLNKEDAFTVTESPWYNSGITSVDPNEVQQDGQYQINIYASGVNFTDSYSSVYSPFNSLSFSGGGIDILTTQVYSDWIQTTIDVNRFASPNERDLTVYTNNYTFYLDHALEITPHDPIEIISVSPTEGEQGSQDLLLTIDIENADFYDMYTNPGSSSSPSIYFSDSDLSGSYQWIVDSNTIAVNVDISPWTDPGYYDLTLGIAGYHGGQMEYDTFSGFEVTQSDNQLLSISPNESYRDAQSLIITLQGENTNWGCCGTPQLSFANSSRDHNYWMYHYCPGYRYNKYLPNQH